MPYVWQAFHLRSITDQQQRALAPAGTTRVCRYREAQVERAAVSARYMVI